MNKPASRSSSVSRLPSRPPSRARRGPWLPLAFLGAVLAAQFWPLTILGRQPIGGDVTCFFSPLMTYYCRALAARRVPLWNELWGFGFPGLAESQMGVFYPPHPLLFGLFGPTWGFSLNLLLHLLLTAWLAYGCGRMFGLGRWGATLAGLSYAGNGLLVIHRSHQWSYTTACWLPLALGLGWQTLRNSETNVAAGNTAPLGRRARCRPALGLALVLAVQLLAGHFQLAFYTQAAVLLMAAVEGVRCLLAASAGAATRLQTLGRLGLIGLAWAAAWTLAAVQVLPTQRLAAYALPAGHDFAYLSGFAQTPLHLINYLAPALFHVNPLWRPVAWDPFHTSPEECIGYVGLAPLGLALIGLLKWRSEPRVRVWLVLAAASLWFSLGPYVPGFHWLIRLPGFQHFRAAARWGMLTALALALLAGRAFDGLSELKHFRRQTLGLLALAAVLLALAVGAIESLAEMAARPRAAAGGWMGAVWRDWFAWRGDPPFSAILVRLTKPAAADPPTLNGLARLGYPASRSRPLSLAGELPAIWRQELLPTVVLLAGVGAAVLVLARKPLALRWALLGLTVADLSWLAVCLSPLEFTDLPPLPRASPTLRELARTPGGRCIGPLCNLPMAAGVAGLISYRTLDIAPPLPHDELFQPAGGAVRDAVVRQTMRTVGARVRVFNPEETDQLDRLSELREAERRGVRAGGPSLPAPADEPAAPAADEQLPSPFLVRRTLNDPALARSFYGTALLAQTGSRLARFSIWSDDRSSGARAWLLPLAANLSLEQALAGGPFVRSARPSDLPPPAVMLLHDARPLELERDQPEELSCTATVAGPTLLFLADLYYPGWKATLERDGRREAAEVHKALDGWRAVRLPAAGRYRIRMVFESPEYLQGRTISLAAFLLWGLLAAWSAWPLSSDK